MMLLALLVSVSVLAAPAAASPRRPIDPPGSGPNWACKSHWVGRTVEIDDGTSGRDKWTITIKHKYRYCEYTKDVISKPHPFADPMESVGSYDFEGKHQDCDFITNPEALKRVRFDNLFHDRLIPIKSRTYFNPVPFNVPCREDTTASAKVTYPEVQRLQWGRGKSPVFNTAVKIDKHAPLGEKSFSILGAFKKVPVE